jgi:hypothetical protein
MRKNDLLLIVAMAILGVLAYFFFLSGKKQSNIVLVVRRDRQVIRRIELQKVRTRTKLPIPVDDGELIIGYNQDGAWVESSPCPDKVCVRQGKITRPGETIACVPEKILLTLTGTEKENDHDAILR